MQATGIVTPQPTIASSTAVDEKPISLSSTLCSEENMDAGLLYEQLNSYILTPAQLSRNNYPRPVSNNPGAVTIEIPAIDACKISSNPLFRVCYRCKTQFAVTTSGDYATSKPCQYHERGPSRGLGLFSVKMHACCNRVEGSRGCERNECHVHRQNYFKDLSDYVQTQPGPTPSDGNHGIYVIDGEMLYTTAGFELASLTVVDHVFNVVYDQLVKPSSPVTDYNTKYSGLSASTLRGVTTTLQDVQTHLLKLFSKDTILIGHSLSSDLVTLKMIHNKVVDTSVLFPHHRGLPFKRPLRTLVQEYLGKTIQNDRSGHSSKEDAVATLELVFYKLKRDRKWPR